jgi:hypothetical protein
VKTLRAVNKITSLHTAAANTITLLGCIKTESGAEFFEGSENNQCVQYICGEPYCQEEMIGSSLLDWLGVCLTCSEVYTEKFC